MLRNVDLHPVPHPEQELGARTIDDEFVERRQEGGALGRRDAPETRARQHVVRLAKTLHLHAREGSILLERGDDLRRHAPSARREPAWTMSTLPIHPKRASPCKSPRAKVNMPD